MNLSHIIPSIDNSTGGPARSVTYLISSILDISNNQVNLFCSESQVPINTNFENSRGNIHFCQYNTLGLLKGLNKKLKLAKSDLLHGHGLWEFPVHQMSLFARKNKLLIYNLFFVKFKFK